MSTNSIDLDNKLLFQQAMDQWFWPTSPLLAKTKDYSESPICEKKVTTSKTSTTTVSTTSSTLHRRQKNWWKVCWIYNNGQFICHQSKQSNLKQFHQQLRQLSMCSTANTTNSTVFNSTVDRCINRDDQLFSMAKPNTRAVSDTQMNGNVCNESKVMHNFPKVPQLTAPEHPMYGQIIGLPEPQSMIQPMMRSQSMSSCSQQMSSSSATTTTTTTTTTTSSSLQQRLTQPLTALLKQRSEHKNSNICQFFIDFKGVEWRAQQLQYQMPTHDIQMFKLQTNEVKFVRNQQRRAQIKPQLFLNKSLNYCFKCKQCIENGSYGVKISVPKSGNQNIGYQTTGEDEDNNVLKVNTTDTSQPPLNGSTALYHIQCFICEECQEVLVDLKAFLYTNSDPNDRLKLTNSLYCSRHFVELFKPRCQSCDHLIFDEECTEAEGKAWHLGHFACNECKRSLGGQQYIMADPSKQNDKKSIYGTKSQVSNNNRPPKLLPYCLTCFDILFGELCEECGELIGCDVGAISHEGRSWHAIDQCFKCNLCSKALLGKPFLPALDGRIYCSISCSQEAVQRQRHRPRKQKHIQTTPSNCINTQSNSNNNLLIKSNNCSEDLIRYQTKSKTSITQMRPNESTHKISQEANCKLPFNENLYNKLTVKEIPTNSDFNSCQPSDELNEFNLKLGEIKLSETKSYGSENSQPNDFVISIDDQKVNQSVNQSVNFDQNFMADNNQMNQQLFEYIQRCQNSTKTPNHFLMEYMKQQLLHNDINGHNGIIGATIECGSSLSEDERTNQHTVDHKVMYNTNVNYNPMTSKTSSESSSLNVTHFDINNTHINGENIIKYNPSITHSSSSNETTPLLLRPLPEKNKSIIQLQNISKPSLNKISMFSQHSLPHRESPSQTSQTSQTSHTTQTSQADQSSNSSFIENSNQTNTSNTHEVMADIRNTVDVNTPSTQSTALQSTSSQTTPETTARTGNKSVTFDPSVKETTGKRISRKPRSRSTHRKSEWTDSHSCSTCSTCSSSSSSSDYDDDFDYQSTLERNRNQWLGGTKIQYVSNDRKKNVTNNVVNGDQNPHNSESCTIA